MNNEVNKPERKNRTRIEWMDFLSPYEYVLLDKMLFQSYLTYANNGQGFEFHVRTLARMTGISEGKVSQTISKWPFVKKTGVRKGMKIQLDYPAFEIWIVQQVNNVCSPDEPRSSTKEYTVTVPKSFVQNMNNESPDKNNPSVARLEPKEVSCVNSEASPSGPVVVGIINCEAFPAGSSNNPKPETSTGSNNPIVHPVNKNKSVRYVPDDEPIMELRMPLKIQHGASAARQSEILKQMKEGGLNFKMDNVIGSERDGFKFCAIEESEKYILITADEKSYVAKPKIQALCKHFNGLGYKVALWTEADQAIFAVEKEQ